MSEVLPALDACGFVRVPGEPVLWMKCERCQKSDHFWIDGAVRCRCGAVYDHALRPDGNAVPFQELSFVPYDKGPLSLRTTEWDPRKIAVLAALLIAVLGSVLWWLRS